MRVTLAIFVLGASFIAALILHQHYRTTAAASSSNTVDLYAHPHATQRPGWVDPLALGICFLGLGGAGALLTRKTI